MNNEIIFFGVMRCFCCAVFLWFCRWVTYQYIVPYLYDLYRVEKETEKERLLHFNRLNDDIVLLHKQKKQLQDDTVTLLAKLEQWHESIALKQQMNKHELTETARLVRRYIAQQSYWLSVEYTRQQSMPEAFAQAHQEIRTTFIEPVAQKKFLNDTLSSFERKSCP